MKNRFIESLFLDARKGKKAAEIRLFKALSERFLYVVKRKLRNENDAQEIAQEALMTVYSKYRIMEHHDNYTAWAYKILQNKLLDFYRKKSFRESSLVSAEIDRTNPEDDTGDRTFEMRIIRCLRKLNSSNPRYARILNLRYQGFSTQEICERLDISRNNLYLILFRARLLLKHCLEKGKIDL